LATGWDRHQAARRGLLACLLFWRDFTFNVLITSANLHLCLHGWVHKKQSGKSPAACGGVFDAEGILSRTNPRALDRKRQTDTGSVRQWGVSDLNRGRQTVPYRKDDENKRKLRMIQNLGSLCLPAHQPDVHAVCDRESLSSKLPPPLLAVVPHLIRITTV
jgi:hypothetical protein